LEEVMKLFGTAGALICFLAVLAGALGSHALQERLVTMGSLSNFELATSYMFFHGLALILAGFASARHEDIFIVVSGWLFIGGTVLFQGNLYLISLTGLRVASFLTPVGGLLLLAGWLSFAISALKSRRKTIN
jgi:uncharacterized membrane protein YgdD (TMEM256/DUF423 family)